LDRAFQVPFRLMTRLATQYPRGAWRFFLLFGLRTPPSLIICDIRRRREQSLAAHMAHAERGIRHICAERAGKQEFGWSVEAA
jgi:hypothetical protein